MIAEQARKPGTPLPSANRRDLTAQPVFIIRLENPLVIDEAIARKSGMRTER
ncbi:MAG: hypothetical protein ACLR1V_09850 [Coprococcus sp.]